MIKSVPLIAVTILIAMITTSCSMRSTKPFPKDAKLVIDLAYTSEQHFKQRYSNLLEIEYPNMRLNIISTKGLIQSVDSSAWIKQNPVDIIYIPSFQIKNFIESGLVADIEPLIKRDQVDLEQFVPSVIELTREYGNGKLYGLPPTFYSRAIIFNKELFDQFNIEYPHDQMSWEEILTLSAKFSTNNSELKGISIGYSTPFELIQHIGRVEGLQLFSHSNQATLNSSSWVTVWENVLRAHESGSLDLNADLNNYLSPFLSGKRAMAVISCEEYKKIEQEKPSFKWSIVTMPVDPEQPDQSNEIRIPGIYAIVNSSGNKEAAWEMLKLFVSNEAARWDYQSNDGFSTRLEQLSTLNQDQLLPFYQLSPKLGDDSKELTLEDTELFSQIIDKIFSRSISLQEGLDALQQEAEQQLEGK
ncbi:extracellular solute-binding protein [Paenibacillus sp. FSL W8-0186]|uniref:ABC transporter substrate-binding protein n=1 Tax=Paenibacillus sp. FSL W8-0186 TaxID=2921709 RepID=UPI0030CD7BC8